MFFSMVSLFFIPRFPFDTREECAALLLCSTRSVTLSTSLIKLEHNLWRSNPTPFPSPPTRALHDALMVVKRMLESNVLVAGGGAVETALSIYLENYATSVGSREQLAIAEFAEALLVIPKTLAVNAAQVRYRTTSFCLFSCALLGWW